MTGKEETNHEASIESAEARQLAEMLKTPLSKDEAAKKFADSDVLKAQLRIARQRTMYEITQLQLKIAAIDEQLLVAEMDSAVTYRRALNAVDGGKDAES